MKRTEVGGREPDTPVLMRKDVPAGSHDTWFCVLGGVENFAGVFVRGCHDDEAGRKRVGQQGLEKMGEVLHVENTDCT